VVDFHPQSGYIVSMIQRNITQKIQAALSDTPVVFLAGARQTGKSTLVQHLTDGGYHANISP